MTTYEIVRFFFRSPDKEVIKTGLTREEAEEHCEDPETSSETCTSDEMVEYTKKHGAWFDGFTKED